MKPNSHPIANQRPIVICGTGGSGTRVVEQLFEKSGYFMGNILNESKDALNFLPVLGANINETLKHTRSVDYTLDNVPEKIATKTRKRLEIMLQRHMEAIPEDAAGWGWKNPRFIFMLPYIHAIRPDFHFVHVIRDGRDMALSDNQNQLQRFYKELFGRPLPLKRLPDPISSMLMWQKVNLEAVHFVRRTRCHYTLVRYEDLCNNPETLKQLQKKFSLPAIEREALISKRATIGRYQKLPPKGLAKLEEIGGKALEFFGYQ